MVGVHTYVEYQQLLKLSLPEKIERAHMVIIEALQKNVVNAVACSWGKDSTVMLHMVLQFCNSGLIVFNNTGVEYPQTLEYRDFMVKEWNIQERYYETVPELSFWQCVEKYGYPHLRQENKRRGKNKKNSTPRCCVELKEKPANKFYRDHNVGLIFVGLQASESMVRRLSFLKKGELYFSSNRDKWICHPLMTWTDQDVWAYHDLYNIPKNPLYNLMSRNGCMPCTGFKNWQKIMANAAPKLYETITRNMGHPVLHDCQFLTKEAT